MIWYWYLYGHISFLSVEVVKINNFLKCCIYLHTRQILRLLKFIVYCKSRKNLSSKIFDWSFNIWLFLSVKKKMVMSHLLLLLPQLWVRPDSHRVLNLRSPCATCVRKWPSPSTTWWCLTTHCVAFAAMSVHTSTRTLSVFRSMEFRVLTLHSLVIR